MAGPKCRASAPSRSDTELGVSRRAATGCSSLIRLKTERSMSRVEVEPLPAVGTAFGCSTRAAAVLAGPPGMGAAQGWSAPCAGAAPGNTLPAAAAGSAKTASAAAGPAGGSASMGTAASTAAGVGPPCTAANCCPALGAAGAAATGTAASVAGSTPPALPSSAACWLCLAAATAGAAGALGFLGTRGCGGDARVAAAAAARFMGASLSGFCHQPSGSTPVLK